MKKYISIITVVFTIGTAGCKKGYLDQEVNPNLPSVTTPQYTLAGAEASSENLALVNVLVRCGHLEVMHVSPPETTFFPTLSHT